MAERISKNKQDDIKRLYLDGLKVRQIAQEVGIGSASVFNVLERLGVKPNRQPRADSATPLDASQLLERLASAEREQGRLEAENRGLKAEVTRLRNADRHRRANPA